MSSFSDNFSRDENKDTQYDDSAVYSFVGTILLVSIIPLLWAIYKRIFFSKELLDKKKYKNCECRSCKERIGKHYVKMQRKNYNFTFYLYIFLVLLLSYLFYLSYFEIVKNGSNFKSFNPYEILEIEPGVDEKVIKKAYRRLTLMFHPDKNPNNLQAKAKFIMIAKAYESLTDEVARKNFELYGNPDGPGSMRLAVGLPSFVLNKKNHMPILFLFLIIIIVIIPGFVWFWFSNSNKYDDSGMNKNDAGIFVELLNENILIRQMPFVLGMAIEFNSFKIRKEETEELEKLWKGYKDQIVKIKEEMIPYPNRKAFCLVYAYLNQVKITSPTLLADLDEVLRIAPILISNMYGMTNEMTKLHMMVDKRYKNFGYNCAKTILEFSQCIHQQIGFNKEASPFLQLPHFNDTTVKNLKLAKPKSEKGEQKKSSFVGFLELPEDERVKILEELGLNKEQVSEVEICVKTFPRYNLKIETFVEGFEEILLEDLLTIKCTIERPSADENIVRLFYR
jgi:translocation protein SEC63